MSRQELRRLEQEFRLASEVLWNDAHWFMQMQQEFLGELVDAPTENVFCAVEEVKDLIRSRRRERLSVSRSTRGKISRCIDEMFEASRELRAEYELPLKEWWPDGGMFYFSSLERRLRILTKKLTS